MTVQDLLNWLDKHKGKRFTAFKSKLVSLASRTKNRVLDDFHEPQDQSIQTRRHFVLGRNHASEMASYAAGKATRYGSKKD